MKQQRRTFDEVADAYASVRPQVPPPAVDALWEHLALSPDGSVVEVGCGTGQLTKHLAERGARVTAIDPGAKLLQACARAVAGQGVTLVESTFEAWDPAGARFDAVAACQAAHWIEPGVFLERAVGALQPGGRLGLLWHTDVSEGTEFWDATQHLYDHYLPDASGKPPRTIPLHVAAYERALGADARFETRPRQIWPWTREYDADSYALMLSTHSPVRMLSEEGREAFIAGHREVIGQLGGQVMRFHETVMLRAMLARA